MIIVKAKRDFLDEIIIGEEYKIYKILGLRPRYSQKVKSFLLLVVNSRGTLSYYPMDYFESNKKLKWAIKTKSYSEDIVD